MPSRASQRSPEPTQPRATALFNLNATRRDQGFQIGLNGWGPNINIVRDPRYGRNSELPSECPVLNGKYYYQYRNERYRHWYLFGKFTPDANVCTAFTRVPLPAGSHTWHYVDYDSHGKWVECTLQLTPSDLQET